MRTYEMHVYKWISQDGGKSVKTGCQLDKGLGWQTSLSNPQGWTLIIDRRWANAL